MRQRIFPVVLLLLILTAIIGGASAQDTTAEPVDRIFVPIGGSYTDTFPGFLDAVISGASGDTISILMLPVTFSYDSQALTAEDLIVNTQDAERRRRQLEDACNEIAPVECRVVVPPIYTREAAEVEAALDYFADPVDGIYILGGDQVIAMEILLGTPLEAAMRAAYESGTVIGGNSAGLAVQAYNMMGGYASEEFGSENGLSEGAVDLWNEPDRRGLEFGVTEVQLEQHFWEYSRLGRFLNALVQEDVPHVGIGVDGYTGAYIRNETVLEAPFGLYTVAIFDMETYGALETATFENDSNTLSVRNVLWHNLPTGEYSYDIPTRTLSMAEAPEEITRDYSALVAPEDAGTLILGGNLFGPLSGEKSAVAEYFVELAGGDEASLVLIATGYADAEKAQEELDRMAGALGIEAITLLNTDSDEIEISGDITGIVVIGDDQSLVDVEALAPVAEAWAGGVPLLMDDAAAAVAGAYYSAHPPVPYDSDDDLAIEAAVAGSFINGGTTIAEGLGLINATFEPQALFDNRWGRIISLAYNHPDLLALALADDAAIEFTAEGATVHGLNGVILFDLASATLELGTNDGFGIANGLIDVYAAGEVIGAD